MLLLTDALLLLQALLACLRAPHYHYSSSYSSFTTACMLAQILALEKNVKAYVWGHPCFFLFEFLKKAEEQSGGFAV